MNIVVVEDEKKTRIGLVRLISKLKPNYHVVAEAANGKEGLLAISHFQPDLVLVDINMPEMNGIDMIKELQRNGIHQKTVFLTGYSEFEYAQQAIRLGASEYLLKPLTADDLAEMLHRLERELLQHKLFDSFSEDNEKASEQIMLKLLSPLSKDREAAALYLEATGFSFTSTIGLVSFYWEGRALPSDELMGQARTALARLCSSSMLAAVASQGEWLCIYQSFTDSPFAVPRQLVDQVTAWTNLPFVVSATSIQRLDQLPDAWLDLQSKRNWALVLPRGAIISKDTIEAHTAELVPFTYPSELENQTLAAIYSNEPWRAMDSITKFLDKIFQKPHHPSQIFEGCLQFFSAMFHIVMKVYPQMLPHSEQQQLIESLTSANTREIIYTIFERFGKLLEVRNKNEPSYSLIIIKTLRMIEERYEQGLSLEEIAGALGITPEYLSSLFNKELGMPFTAFLKQLRVKKSIDYLMNTDLKTYEIGKKVGYPDPKYFSRVFKELTGFPPANYQKMFK